MVGPVAVCILINIWLTLISNRRAASEALVSTLLITHPYPFPSFIYLLCYSYSLIQCISKLLLHAAICLVCTLCHPLLSLLSQLHSIAALHYYFPEGTDAPAGTPCNGTASVLHRCEEGAACLTSGLVECPGATRTSCLTEIQHPLIKCARKVTCSCIRIIETPLG